MPVVPNGTTEIVPTRNYNAGSFSSQPWDLQVGQSKITISADRNAWPVFAGGDVISLRFDILIDGGPQQLLAGFTAAGGVLNDPWTGAVAPQSYFTVSLPQPQNPDRKIIASVTIFTRINTGCSMTVS